MFNKKGPLDDPMKRTMLRVKGLDPDKLQIPSHMQAEADAKIDQEVLSRSKWKTASKVVARILESTDEKGEAVVRALLGFDKHDPEPAINALFDSRTRIKEIARFIAEGREGIEAAKGLKEYAEDGTLEKLSTFYFFGMPLDEIFKECGAELVIETEDISRHEGYEDNGSKEYVEKLRLGQEDLSFLLYRLQKYYDAFPGMDLSSLHSFLDSVEELSVSFPVVSRFLQDSQEELLRTSYGQWVMERVAGLNGINQHSRERSFKNDFACSQGTVEVAELMSGVVDRYLPFVGAEGLLKLCLPGNVSPADYIGELGSYLSRIRESGVAIDSKFLALVRRCKGVDQTELLERIQATPSIIELYRMIHSDISAAEYVQGVLATGWSSERDYCGELLNLQREGALTSRDIAALLKRKVSPFDNDLFQRIEQEESLNPLLKPLLMGMSKGDRSLVELVEGMRKEELEDRSLVEGVAAKLLLVIGNQRFWGSFAELSGDEEGGRVQLLLDTPVVEDKKPKKKKRKGKGSRNKQGPSNDSPESIEEKYPWLGDVEVAQREDVALLYQALPEEQRGRVRQVVQRHPETLFPFFSIVSRNISTKYCDLILESDQLFKRFISLIEEKGLELVEEEFSQHCKAGDSNPYRTLAAWLRNSEMDRLLLSLDSEESNLSTEEVKDEPIEISGLRRIVIIGGMYRADSRDRVLESVPGGIDCRIYDKNTWDRFDGGSLDPTIAVIVNTSALSHSAYAKFRRDAARKGAYFYHIKESGVDSITAHLRRFRATE